MANWFPISTALSEVGPGSMIALAPAGAGASADAAVVLDRFRVFQDSVSRDVAEHLGFASIFDQKHHHQECMINYECMLYHQTDVSGDPTGVYGQRKGVGVRVAVGVWSDDFAFKLDAYSVALATQMQLARSFFRIEMPGITDKSVIKEFPQPGQLDPDNLSRIGTAVSKAMAFVKSHAAELSPATFQVCLGGPAADSLKDRAYAAVYANNRIVRGKSLTEALDTIPTDVDSNIVRAVYDEILGAVPEGTKPDGGQKKKAETWLHV